MTDNFVGALDGPSKLVPISIRECENNRSYNLALNLKTMRDGRMGIGTEMKYVVMPWSLTFSSIRKNTKENENSRIHLPQIRQFTKGSTLPRHKGNC